MSSTTRIHHDKNPRRIHYIPEWAEYRGIQPKDFVERLGVDKSQVSRWFSGNMPRPETLHGIATVLSTEVEALFRHPEDDWMTRLLRGRSADEKARLREAFEAVAKAMPRKAG